MQIAAFLITLACTVTPGAATDSCQKYETQKWEAPSMAELKNCADLAEQLSNLNKPSTCEVVPMADTPKVSYRKGPSRALNGKALSADRASAPDLTNRELQNQRGTGAEQPRAQLILPTGFAPQPGFMY